jgi:hypothetical protein
MIGDLADHLRELAYRRAVVNRQERDVSGGAERPGIHRHGFELRLPLPRLLRPGGQANVGDKQSRDEANQDVFLQIRHVRITHFSASHFSARPDYSRKMAGRKMVANNSSDIEEELFKRNRRDAYPIAEP